MADPDATPFGVPARLTAGDSWAWVSGVPAAEGVDLAVTLRPLAGGSPVRVAASIEDGRRVARHAAALTALVPPGVYLWAEVLTRPADGARWTAGAGRVEVLPDPGASGGDLRSQAERILDAIDARLEGRANADCDAYSIEGRSISRTPLEVLLRVRGVYARRVAAEQGRGGVQFHGVTFR